MLQNWKIYLPAIPLSNSKSMEHSFRENADEIQELLNKNNIDKVKERIINILDKLENNKGR